MNKGSAFPKHLRSSSKTNAAQFLRTLCIILNFLNSGRHSSQDKDSPDASETFITHSNISTRSNILSLEPLNSIIEAADQIRRVESETSSHVTQLSKSTEKISLDDVSLQESDESCYDTDLEEDFPGIFIKMNCNMTF